MSCGKGGLAAAEHRCAGGRFGAAGKLSVYRLARSAKSNVSLRRESKIRAYNETNRLATGPVMPSKSTAANKLIGASKLAAASVLLCGALIWSSGAWAQSNVHLSAAGRAAIWRSLGKDATDTQVAAGLQVGQTVPDPMRVLPFSGHLRKRVPAIRSYSYALVNGQVLIVDARNRKIVAIISE